MAKLIYFSLVLRKREEKSKIFRTQDLPKNADYWYMTAICNAHLGSAYSKGGVMGPMITYHDTVALQFPLKSPHHEETAKKMNTISKPKIPKTQVLPAQDYEKTKPSQPETISPQIEVSPLGQGLLYRWTEPSILPMTTGGGF